MSLTNKARQKLAIERFREIEQLLPGLLRDLLNGQIYRRGVRPAVPAIAGVYLFTENETPRYVGRTRNANRRLGEHIQDSSGENSAPFAFNIAKGDAQRAGLELVGSRKEIAAMPDFMHYFLAAKQRVRKMEFRVIEVPVPTVSTVFEVYASIALGTEGEFNRFDTH